MAGAGRAGDARDRLLGPAHPGRADEPHARQGESADDVIGARIRRGEDRDAQVLDQAERRRADGGGGLAQRHPVQRPPALAALAVQRLHPAVGHLVRVAAQVHHVAEEVLVRAAGVEEQVAVEVLAVELAVAAAAAGAEVAPGEDLDDAGELAIAERHVLEGDLPLEAERVRPVAEDADVVLVGIEDAVGAALGIEPPQAHVLPAGEDAVLAGQGEGPRRDRECVLAHRPQVDHEVDARRVRRVRAGLEDPELQVLGAGEVHAGGAERRHHRAPARAERPGRERPLRGGGAVVPHQAARRIRVQGEPERRLELLAAAGRDDGRVDVLRADPERAALGVRHQVLPDQLDRVLRIEGRPEAEQRIHAVGGLGNAAEFPGHFRERQGRADVRLELLEVRRTGAVRIRPRERELGVEVDAGGRGGGRRGEPVEEPGDGARLEVQVGGDAADQVGLGLEAELGPVVGGRLALEDAEEVDRAELAERVARGEAEDRGRGDGEEVLLLEAGADLCRSGAEERIGIEEGHLSRRVVDGIVHAALEQAAAAGELLASLLDLQRVEAQRRAIGAAHRLVAEPDLEARRRPLAEEQVERRPVERIGALGGGEPLGVGERGEMRKDDVGLAHHLVGARVAGARKEPVLPVDHALVGRDGQPELRQVGAEPRRRALGAVEEHRHVERRGLEVAAGHAIHLAHLVAEGAGIGAAKGLEDQDQAVDRRRPVDCREGADGAAACRHVAHGQVVARVELGREREPEPRRIEIVIAALLEERPLDPLVGGREAEALGRRAGLVGGEGPDAAQVRVDAAGGRRAIPVDPDFGRPVGGRDDRGIDVQDVDGRMAGDALGIDHPEEAAGLEVEVAHDPVLGLAGGAGPDVEDALGDGAALLGRHQRLELHRPQLEDAVHAEIGPRHRGGEEARRRRPEGHRAHLDALHHLVGQAFVVDLDVVVGGEVAVGVVVDVDVHPLADGAAGADADLVLEPGGPDAAAAAGVGDVGVGGGAALVVHPLGADVEPGLAVEGQVGILLESPEDPVRGCSRRRGVLRGLLGHAVDHPLPDGRGAGQPGRVEGGGDGAVVAGHPGRRGPEPGRAQRGRLGQPGDRDAEPERQARQRIDPLRGERGGGDEQEEREGRGKANHARQSRNPACRWKGGGNIMDVRTPYKVTT